MNFITLLSLLVFCHHPSSLSLLFFFFNAPATTEIYTLSLHDALPISLVVVLGLIFWFTWSSIQSSQGQTDWDFTTMMTRAAQGQVRVVDITGTDGVVTDVDGHKHNVVLPDCSGECKYQDDLRSYSVQGGGTVTIKFEKSQTGSYLISVLLPNIILVILIAAFMWWVLRQTQSGNNQAISFGRSRARMIAGDK